MHVLRRGEELYVYGNIGIEVYFILMEFQNVQFDISLIYETTRITQQPTHSFSLHITIYCTYIHTYTVQYVILAPRFNPAVG